MKWIESRPESTGKSIEIAKLAAETSHGRWGEKRRMMYRARGAHQGGHATARFLEGFLEGSLTVSVLRRVLRRRL